MTTAVGWRGCLNLIRTLRPTLEILHVVWDLGGVFGDRVVLSWLLRTGTWYKPVSRDATFLLLVVLVGGVGER